MALHLRPVAVHVHRLTPLLRELDGELEGEPVRRGQRERLLTRDRLVAGEPLEELEASLERLSEALLLRPDDGLDLVGALVELRIGLRHLPHDDGRQAVHVGEPDPLRLLDGSPDDAAEDVAAALVGRGHPVADEERHPAAVIREHPVRLGRLGRVPVGDARLGGDPVHDLAVPVGLVDRHHVLQDRRGALQPHAGVDVLGGERRERPVRVLLELHEDEVPELEEPLATRAGRRAVRLPTTMLLPPVVVELGVRPARPGAAHRPEVLGRGQGDDPLRRHPDPPPQIDRDLIGAEPELGIAGVHARPHVLPVDPQVLPDELRGELDRPFLEVLPEREVPEHLEEREVRAVEPDLVDVRCPEALLHRGRERRRGCLPPEEVRHLRLHAGRRQQRGVVVRARDERRRGDTKVALRLEVREKALAELGRGTHAVILRAGVRSLGVGAQGPGGAVSEPGWPAAWSSSSISVSRRAAASFATDTASPTSRRARRAPKPCEIPEATPDTFLTGVVIAVETARTAVSALSAIETALSVTTSILSSWSFTRSTVPPDFTITGSRSRSVPLMRDDSRAKVPPSRIEHVGERGARYEEEHCERVVEDVAGGRGEDVHGSDPRCSASPRRRSGGARDDASADDGVPVVQGRHLPLRDAVRRLLELEHEAAVRDHDRRRDGRGAVPELRRDSRRPARGRVHAPRHASPRAPRATPTTTSFAPGSVRSTYSGRPPATPSPRRCPGVKRQ